MNNHSINSPGWGIMRQMLPIYSGLVANGWDDAVLPFLGGFALDN